jgi:hypothetical protein
MSDFDPNAKAKVLYGPVYAGSQAVPPELPLEVPHSRLSETTFQTAPSYFTKAVGVE